MHNVIYMISNKFPWYIETVLEIAETAVKNARVSRDRKRPTERIWDALSKETMARNRLFSRSFSLGFVRRGWVESISRQTRLRQVTQVAAEHNEIHNARWNFSRLPLMPHRPLFVSQCHHFSPVIYFIAISVSLPPPLVSSSLFLHLRSPRSLSFSLSLTLSPALTVSTNTFSLETLHRTTQHNSALLTLSCGGFIIRFYLCLVLSFSFSQSRARTVVSSLSLALPRTSGIWTTVPNAREREKEGTRDRTRSKERQRKNKRERERRENAERGEETTLARARRARRRERYNCI